MHHKRKQKQGFLKQVGIKAAYSILVISMYESLG